MGDTNWKMRPKRFPVCTTRKNGKQHYIGQLFSAKGHADICTPSHQLLRHAFSLSSKVEPSRTYTYSTATVMPDSWISIPSQNTEQLRSEISNTTRMNKIGKSNSISFLTKHRCKGRWGQWLFCILAVSTYPDDVFLGSLCSEKKLSHNRTLSMWSSYQRITA